MSRSRLYPLCFWESSFWILHTCLQSPDHLSSISSPVLHPLLVRSLFQRVVSCFRPLQTLHSPSCFASKSVLFSLRSGSFLAVCRPIFPPIRPAHAIHHRSSAPSHLLQNIPKLTSSPVSELCVWVGSALHNRSAVT